jgi:hypothetical protein
MIFYSKVFVDFEKRCFSYNKYTPLTIADIETIGM